MALESDFDCLLRPDNSDGIGSSAFWARRKRNTWPGEGNSKLFGTRRRRRQEENTFRKEGSRQYNGIGWELFVLHNSRLLQPLIRHGRN